MARIHFDRTGVLKLIAHAKAATEHQKPHGTHKKAPPGLMLVGDDGIYLMSNGVPRMRLSPTSESSFVVYAKECDPTKMTPDACWDAKNRLFGGDDGVEQLPAEGLLEALTTYPPDKKNLIVDINQHRIAVISFVKSPAAGSGRKKPKPSRVKA